MEAPIPGERKKEDDFIGELLIAPMGPIFTGTGQMKKLKQTSENKWRDIHIVIVIRKRTKMTSFVGEIFSSFKVQRHLLLRALHA